MSEWQIDEVRSVTYATSEKGFRGFCFSSFWHASLWQKPESTRYKALYSKHKERPYAISEAQPFSVFGEQNGQSEVSAEVHRKTALKFQSWKLLNKETEGMRKRWDTRESEKGGCDIKTEPCLLYVIVRVVT